MRRLFHLINDILEVYMNALLEKVKLQLFKNSSWLKKLMLHPIS